MKLANHLKKMPVVELKPHPQNPRVDYDIPSMMEEICQAKRVLEPLTIKEDGTILKGHRRFFAVTTLLKDPSIPADLKANIEKLDVRVAEDLSSAEEIQLLFDHGSQKPLNRVEIVKAVWTLHKQMFSPTEIVTLMYNQLAKFTGNPQKAYQAAQITDPQARVKFLKTWLHGTVDNYLLVANRLGERVRKNVILTETEKDRPLTDEEKKAREFVTKTSRIADLNKAKAKDENTKDGGSGWTAERGGKFFNDQIQVFIDEDKGVKPTGDKRYTPTQMKEAAELMKSSLKMAYQHCAGDLTPDEKKRLTEEVDTELYRLETIRATIIGKLDHIKDKTLNSLLTTIAYGTAETVGAELEKILEHTKDKKKAS